MGVGTPADLLEAIARGVDMFDCVMPTRNGRHGLAFTRFGPINIKNAHHADDARPLDASRCPAARDFSAPICITCSAAVRRSAVHCSRSLICFITKT